jgi:hypothetical protein
MYKEVRKIFFVSALTISGIVLCISTFLFVGFHAIPNCINTPASKSNLPIYPLLLEIEKSDVTVTGKTKLRIGQTFVVGGDGRWFSNTTLLAINANEAIFLLEYYDYEKERSNFCLWHALKQEINE